MSCCCCCCSGDRQEAGHRSKREIIITIIIIRGSSSGKQRPRSCPTATQTCSGSGNHKREQRGRHGERQGKRAVAEEARQAVRVSVKDLPHFPLPLLCPVSHSLFSPAVLSCGSCVTGASVITPLLPLIDWHSASFPPSSLLLSLSAAGAHKSHSQRQ